MREYQKYPAMSSTMLRVLADSPLTYHRMVTGQLRREPTEAMEFGTAAHSVILEGKLDSFYISPAKCADGSEWSGRKSECKVWVEAHGDRPIISAEQAAQLSETARYIREHHQAGKLCIGATPEVSVIIGGEKARCDLLRLDGDHATIIDLKTTVSARTADFQREILNREYYVQAAWYRRVLKAAGAATVRFIFLALQKGQLPLVNVLELSTAAMDLGDAKIKLALDLGDKCKANQYWPEWADFDGSNEIKTVDVPERAYPEPELTGSDDA